MKQSDIVVATRPVIQVFDDLNIDYYIGGSVASSAYGIARATMDVDMVADIKPRHISVLVQRLESAYYIDANMMLNAIMYESSFNLVHLETMLKVDVFILKNKPYHQTALQRRRKDTLGEGQDAPEFYFTSAEDIVLLKLDWFRMGNEVSDRQWTDVLGVLKVQKNLLDISYLKLWAEKLEIADILERAFEESGIDTHF